VLLQSKSRSLQEGEALALELILALPYGLCLRLAGDLWMALGAARLPARAVGAGGRMEHGVKNQGRICSRAAFALTLVACSACGVDVEDVREHAAQWKQQDIDNYVFVLFESCDYCDVFDPSGFRVTVRDGIAQEARGVRTGIPSQARAVTIENLYERAIKIAESDPDEFKITYDIDRKFPKSIYVDTESEAQDDENTLEVRCFSQELDDGCPVKSLSLAECQEENNGTATPVNVDDPGLTCGGLPPGAIGRIEGDERVCCST
jgi:hypothetical protein